MSHNEIIHIALASDANYAEFVATAIVSIYATSEKEITIHLLSNGIDDSNIDKIRMHVPEDRGRLVVYDIRNLDSMIGIKVSDCIAIAAYSRLFIPKLLSEDIEKVLYIDSDIIFNRDVAELWQENLADYWTGGVIDAWFGTKTKTEIGLSKDAPYINSGVLMMNLKAWRENDVLEKSLAFLEKHNGIVYHSDQGLINAVCAGHVKILPPKFNLTSNYLAFPYKFLCKRIVPFYSKDAFDKGITQPVCIHFTPGLFGRPWVDGCKHPMLDKYESAHQKTLWKDAPLRAGSDSVMYRLVKWTYAHLPLWCYSLLTTMIDALLMVKMKLK